MTQTFFLFGNDAVKLGGRKQREDFDSAEYKHMLQAAPVLRASFSS